MRSTHGFFPAIAVLALSGISLAQPQPPRTTITSLVLPQFAFGGGWTTTFILVNLDVRPANYKLFFRDGGGRDLSVPFLEAREVVEASSFQGTIQPGQSLFLATRGNDGQAPSQGLALLTAQGRVGGMALLQQSVGDRPDYEAAIPFNSFNQSSVTVPFDNKLRPGRCPPTSLDPCPSAVYFSTGIAVGVGVDLTASDGSIAGAIMGGPYLVSIVVKDESGSVLVEDLLPFRGNGQMAFSLGDLYPQTKTRRGAVTLTLQPSPASSGLTLAGLALRFNPGGGFTSLQAIPSR